MRPWAFVLSSLMNLSLRRVCVSSSMRFKNSFVVAFIDWLIGCESMGVWVEPRLGRGDERRLKQPSAVTKPWLNVRRWIFLSLIFVCY